MLGALRAARENLRHARVSAPPELWLALNNQYLLLSGAAEQPMPRVLDALSSVLEAGSRIKGVFESNMARDAAYSFLNIGVELERADMLLRVLARAAAHDHGERLGTDLRRRALVGPAASVGRALDVSVSATTIRPIFRRCSTSSRSIAASPRSVVHCLRLVEGELRNLPRAGQASAAVTMATSSAFALAHAGNEELPEAIEATLTALAAVHTALVTSYFPGAGSGAAASSRTRERSRPPGTGPVRAPAARARRDRIGAGRTRSARGPGRRLRDCRDLRTSVHRRLPHRLR